MDDFNQSDVLRIRHNLDMANIMGEYKNAKERFQRFVNNLNGKITAISEDTEITQAERATYLAMLTRAKNTAFQNFRDIAI